MRTCRIGDFALLVSRNRIMILGRTCMIRHTGMACLCRFMLSCLKLLHVSSWSEYFKFACSDSIISCDKNTNSNWLYTSSSHVSVVCTTGHGQPGQDSCPWQSTREFACGNLLARGAPRRMTRRMNMMTGWSMMRKLIVQIFIARILVSNIMYNNVHFCGILCDIVLFCLILLNIVGVLQN